MVSFSVIIVTHGREELLIKCLNSLHPGNVEWQLVLMSHGVALRQDIKEIAESLTPHCTFLHSENRLTPGQARNMALSASDGEWIFFLDDDAFVLPHYWENILPLLTEQKFDVIGGPDAVPVGMSAFPTALALALTSPFCTGMTFHRHKASGNKIKSCDEEYLTSCNLWVRKSALEGLSFPEDFVRAEEIVLLQKLKKIGKGLYYNPKMRVAHYRRSRLKDLWRPSFYAGFSRSKLMREKIQKGNEAFWLPSIFVLLHFIAILDLHSFAYMARMYLSIIFFVSIALSMRIRKTYLFPLVAFMHYFIVFMFGLGFLTDRFKNSWRKRDT